MICLSLTSADSSRGHPMRLLSYAALLSLFVTSASAQDMTANGVLKGVQGRDSSTYHLYLNGASEGIMVANIAAKKRTGQGLYCAEQATQIGAITILTNAVRRDRELGKMPVGLALMDEMLHSYPCK